MEVRAPGRSRSGVLYAFGADRPLSKLRVYPSGEKSIMVQVTKPGTGLESELSREEAADLMAWIREWLTNGSRKGD